MAFVATQLFQANTTALLTSSATTCRVSPANAASLNAQLGTGNYTICTISNGAVTELIYITTAAPSTGVLTIVRAQEGTTAQTFPVGALIRFVWTVVGIQETASGGSSGITITGAHATSVTGGPFAFVVDTPAGNLIAGTGMTVTGTWPNITITNAAPATGGGGTVTVVTGSGDAVASAITGGFNINVPTPAFTAGTGVSITGTWPNLTITNSAPAMGGAGTVTSVTAGTGITVTGSPTITPTIGLTPTGITAGVYGGLTVNAAGQLTAISSSLLNGVASANNAITVSAPVAGVVTLTAVNATTANHGVVQLATPSAPSSSDPTDSTSAVTPAGIAAVLAAQQNVILGAVSSLTPLTSSSYSVVVGVSATTLNLQAGHNVIIDAFVEVFDPVNPTVIPTFALGLFNGGTFLIGNGLVPGYTRQIKYQISGPFTGVISLNIVPLTGTNAIQSYGLGVTAN